MGSPPALLSHTCHAPTGATGATADNGLASPEARNQRGDDNNNKPCPTSGPPLGAALLTKQRSETAAVPAEAAAAGAAAYFEALKRIQSCKMFCNRVSQTASMHSPPVTPTELNLHKMLQSALSEIHRQLESLEIEVAVDTSTLGQQVTCGGGGSSSSGVQRS